jgi:hypothetical protein
LKRAAGETYSMTSAIVQSTNRWSAAERPRAIQNIAEIAS